MSNQRQALTQEHQELLDKVGSEVNRTLVLKDLSVEEMEAEIRRRSESDLDSRVSVITPHRKEWGQEDDRASDVTIRVHKTQTGRDQNEKVELELNLLDLVEKHLANLG